MKQINKICFLLLIAMLFLMLMSCGTEIRGFDIKSDSIEKTENSDMNEDSEIEIDLGEITSLVIDWKEEDESSGPVKESNIISSTKPAVTDEPQNNKIQKPEKPSVNEKPETDSIVDTEAEKPKEDSNELIIDWK